MGRQSEAGAGVLTSATATHEPTGATFQVAEDQVVLDAGLEQDVDLAHGCRVGACGACAVEVVEGLEHALPPDPIEADSLSRYAFPPNVRLACRLRVRGPISVRPSR
jgi:CDP-4-dehydro-6-deoxyglucose reductase